MTTLEVLKAAREKIADPYRWVKGEMCVPSSVAPWSKRCTGWCALGAIANVRNGWATTSDLAALGTMHESRTSDFNDSHTHPEVIDMFDKAIAAEESKQAA